jgi:hypothetical protein
VATFFLAEILPEHYDAFRKILNQSLPDSFDAWSYRQSERVATRAGKGHAVYEVKVNPDEFTRYCGATNSVRDLQSLDRFASEKAGGKRY